MKRFLLITLAAFWSLGLWAQEEKKEEDDKKEGGFKKEMLFTGGNVNIYFGGATQLGATPQLGYSVANWLDAGVLFGYNYISQRVDLSTTVRKSLFGPGAFVRLFPVNFLFANIQYEHNFIKYREIYPDYTYRYNYDVNSLLLGVGYTNAREERNSFYYYFSVSFDVLNDPNSPYKTWGNQVYPVFNAGFNVPLFQGGGRRR